MSALPFPEPQSAPSGAPAVELQSVEFSYAQGGPVLSIAHLRIERGERVFLVGPSGSGKSTLLGLIGGVLTPKQGSVQVIGTPLSGLESSRRDRFRGEHIGFIFQMFNLIPYLTVRENVLLPLQFSAARSLRLQGTHPGEEASRLLAALGLTEAGLIERRVTELSIGQQQRVAAARALIGRPALVIADEPTSALDADTRDGFLKLLLSECRSFGTTLLFVSHDSALGTRFDRTLRMSEISGRDSLAQA
jgi:putative ABC transport system ATP-binding protein